MIIYLYDGSFEGLLTAIYESYYLKDKPEKIYSKENFQPNLLDDTIYIETDGTKADKVYESIGSKISKNALRNVYHIFLSEHQEAGTMIYNYLRLGWRMGNSVDLNLMDNRVMVVQEICNKVSRERHRMLGLIRFQQLKGDFYYAPIEPDYNIIGLVAPHFVERMGDQNWMIHDKKRNIAAVTFHKQWVLTNIDDKFTPSLGDEEINYQKLWREYFNNISIEERYNPKLQRKNMPSRYWNNLIEK